MLPFQPLRFNFIGFQYRYQIYLPEMDYKKLPVYVYTVRFFSNKLYRYLISNAHSLNPSRSHHFSFHIILFITAKLFDTFQNQISSFLTHGYFMTEFRVRLKTQWFKQLFGQILNHLNSRIPQFFYKRKTETPQKVYTFTITIN